MELARSDSVPATKERVKTSVGEPVTSERPKTLIEAFERVARDQKRSDTLNYKRDGRWIPISSDELLARAHHIAAGLYSLGVRPGDRVALLSDSRPEWTLTDAGCLFAGAIDVPIYPTLTPTQVRYILKDSGSRVLVVSNHKKFLQVRNILDECPAVEQVVFFDDADLETTDGITLDELERRGQILETEQPRLIDDLAHRITPDQLATIIYTSGTTGEPKGVMLTHSNLISNLIDGAGNLSFDERDIALSVLPLSHIFERQAMYMYLYQGMAVYYAESLETIGANLREVRPTILVGVPRIFEKIYDRIKERVAAKGRFNMALLSWPCPLQRLMRGFRLIRKRSRGHWS